MYSFALPFLFKCPSFLFIIIELTAFFNVSNIKLWSIFFIVRDLHIFNKVIYSFNICLVKLSFLLCIIEIALFIFHVLIILFILLSISLLRYKLKSIAFLRIVMKFVLINHYQYLCIDLLTLTLLS